MRTATVFLVMTMTMAACEFDESGLGPPYEGEASTPDGGPSAEQVTTTQHGLLCWLPLLECVDRTGIPSPTPVTPPPGGGTCTGVNPLFEVPMRTVRVWINANGGETESCVDFPLGNYPRLRNYGLNDRISSVKVGGCVDLMLWEHDDFRGAPNHVYWMKRDGTGVNMTDGWNDRASSLQVRPLENGSTVFAENCPNHWTKRL